MLSSFLFVFYCCGFCLFICCLLLLRDNTSVNTFYDFLLQTFYFLSDWSLNFIIIMVLLHYITVYHIIKLHFIRLFYLMLWLLFSIAFAILFLFLFLSFYLPFYHPSNSVWSCLTFVVLSRIVSSYLLSFYIIIYPA